MPRYSGACLPHFLRAEDTGPSEGKEWVEAALQAASTHSFPSLGPVSSILLIDMQVIVLQEDAEEQQDKVLHYSQGGAL